MAKVLVVGAGIAGLLSACFAAKRGHVVKVLAYGQGALTVAGGIIDLFGYDAQGKEITNPLKHIASLKKPHPYALVGQEGVLEAVEAFKDLMAEHNYPYLGDAEHNQTVATAIGSFKPSCLIPQTLDTTLLFERKKIVVLGFELLKDYYPKLVAKNLSKYFGDSKEITIHNIMLNWPSGREYRDVSALDLARALEDKITRLNIIEQLKGKVDQDTTVIIPPVLAEKPELSYSIAQELEDKLKAKFIEVSSMPPSVTGLRLDRLLFTIAQDLGVTIIEKALVIGANEKLDYAHLNNHSAHSTNTSSKDNSSNKICSSLLTGGFGRVREYSADAVIVATGGFFGDGLVTEMGRMYEPIFNLEIPVPEDQKDWSHQYLFEGKPQPFASYGVAVNEHLQPINTANEVLWKNVFFAGRVLQGYDFCFEKSGNGVALISAYHAAKQLDNLDALGIK